MKLTSKSIVSATALLVGGFIGASALVVLANSSDGTWTSAPTGVPNNNVAAPINVGGATQQKNGWLGVIGLVTANLNVASGTVSTNGSVLTNDGSGNAYWAAGGAGNSSDSSGTSGLVFITPVVLASTSISTSWQTISGLTGYGVPATASAVILSTDIITYNANASPLAHIYMRPSSTGSTYILAGTRTAGGGAPVLGASNQGIYPISSSSGFDYKADSTAVGSGSSITLIGYVTGSVSVTGSTDSIMLGAARASTWWNGSMPNYGNNYATTSCPVGYYMSGAVQANGCGGGYCGFNVICNKF